MTPRRIFRGIVLTLGLALAIAACGGGQSGSSPSSESGAVSGLLVVSGDVQSGTKETLGAPPAAWTAEADATSFARALSAADWAVQGRPEQQGVTATDGRFEIEGLDPGLHILDVTKTLDGNLVAFAVPFVVGDDGEADVVVEMSWGAVRSESNFRRAGKSLREVYSPAGVHLVTVDGRVVELGDPGRTLKDADGDGRFEQCVPKAAGDLCETVTMQRVTVYGAPVRLVRGQQWQLSAVLELADGGTYQAIDVTSAVEWRSSNESVARVDSWGRLESLALGAAEVTAGVGGLVSAPARVDVVERPALRRIYVQNTSCIYPMGAPEIDAGAAPPVLVPPSRTGIFAPPSCNQVVQVGNTIQFTAWGEFDDGYFQDVTAEVTWDLSADVGDVVNGLFSARLPGSAALTAKLGAVVSEAIEIRVVTEPSVLAVSIYADNGGPWLRDGGPMPMDFARPEPCFDCGYSLTVLRGDELRFHATAQYDTGGWEDVSDRVAWRTSDPLVAEIDNAGVMTAVEGGGAVIDAALGEIASNRVEVRVVNEATLQYLSIYQEGGDRVVAKGDQRFFHAMGSYDVGFGRDVTKEASWRSSDENVGGFDGPGAFIARRAGVVQVWAELDGKQSERLVLEVFEQSELAYCDPERINRALWSDDFNRVTLESDCAEYTSPGLVTLRYTVTETQTHGGIFDPCLDLYVYQGPARIRTIREEGCGDPFLPAGAPDRASEMLKYQLRAFWDMKSDTGEAVPPGTYTVHGRFYLYYDPVVSIDVTVR